MMHLHCCERYVKRAGIECSELILCRVLASGGCARRAGGERREDSVDVVGAAPLLVREHVAPELLLLALHEFDVREHAILLVAGREFSCWLNSDSRFGLG